MQAVGAQRCRDELGVAPPVCIEVSSAALVHCCRLGLKWPSEFVRRQTWIAIWIGRAGRAIRLGWNSARRPLTAGAEDSAGALRELAQMARKARDDDRDLWYWWSL
jgi:hypothetical protein